MEVIMAKYGEIALKGLNRSNFENLLIRNIKRRLKNAGDFEVTRRQSTIYIEPLKDSASSTAAVCPAPDRGMDAAYRSPASAPSVTRV